VIEAGVWNLGNNLAFAAWTALLRSLDGQLPIVTLFVLHNDLGMDVSRGQGLCGLQKPSLALVQQHFSRVGRGGAEAEGNNGSSSQVGDILPIWSSSR
jgi:hypothetical protein